MMFRNSQTTRTPTLMPQCLWYCTLSPFPLPFRGKIVPLMLPCPLLLCPISPCFALSPLTSFLPPHPLSASPPCPLTSPIPVPVPSCFTPSLSPLASSRSLLLCPVPPHIIPVPSSPSSPLHLVPSCHWSPSLSPFPLASPCPPLTPFPFPCPLPAPPPCPLMSPHPCPCPCPHPLSLH